jgi:hypothetical protein
MCGIVAQDLLKSIVRVLSPLGLETLLGLSQLLLMLYKVVAPEVENA